MKFIDVARFTVQGGNGGDGAVSFRHELYVDKGGPNGGDGGDGGDIIFVGDLGKHSLLDLKMKKKYEATAGEKGGIKNMHGARGKDYIIHVPLGTVLVNEKTGEIIADINRPNKKMVIAKGGKGGRGNARFANSRNKAPTIFEAGESGEKIALKAELKVLADVGFVGLPNAGKSTLLRNITNAKAEVGDYAFTTLNPQLGTAKSINGQTFVVADLPGLIEGASLGKGLGHEFLKHVERCKVVCHVIDWSGNFGQEDVIKNYEMIRKELKNYNYKLDELPEIIVANKMDLDEAQINLLDEKITKYFKNKPIIYVSGLKKSNLDKLTLKMAEALTKVKNQAQIEKNNKQNYRIYQLEEKPIDIKIMNLGNGKWEVSGETVHKIYSKNPIRTNDNLLLFNEKLKSLGIFDQLRQKGIKNGDVVKIFDYELEWMN